MKNHIYILLSLLIAGLSISHSSPAMAARSYLVELVVFSSHDNGGEEKWTTAAPPLNARKLSRATRPAQIMDELKEDPVEIKESDFSVYVERIRKNSGRTILLSTHWVQTVLSPANTVIARITNRVDLPNDMKTASTGIKASLNDDQYSNSRPILDGFINFYLAGTYTIEADIRYTPAYRPSILDEDPITSPTTYRIYEKRKMKSGELNYYDHPKIGMVLRVTPVEIATEESALGTKN